MIFFDLDGPILDVSGRYYALYSQLLMDAGGRPISRDDYWQRKRNKESETDILAASGFASGHEGYALRRKALIEEPRFLELDEVQRGAHQALASLQPRGLCLVTVRSNRSNLMAELDRLDIKKYFIAVLSEEAGGEAFRVKIRLIRNFQKEVPAASVIIGDTEAEILAGRALGLKTIAVLSGIRSREFLLKYNPDLIIDGIWNLPEVYN